MKSSILTLIMLLSILYLQAQNNRTTFGLQYKPIIPVKYFNSDYINTSITNYDFNLSPRYSNSFGMVIRHKINNTFSIESGINYIQRNYKLSVDLNSGSINDFTDFSMRSYEVPLQLLTYVRASEFWYLNVSFGISNNILASDIISTGQETNYFFQNTYRRSEWYSALLANIGMEYRTEHKGRYYLGTSLHLPWKEISRVYPEYNDDINIFNDEDFNDKFFLELPGNFITLDLRYFFKP